MSIHVPPHKSSIAVLDSSRLSTTNQNPTILCSNKQRYLLVVIDKSHWGLLVSTSRNSLEKHCLKWKAVFMIHIAFHHLIIEIAMNQQVLVEW
jgi:hypothetical protein